MKDAIQVIRAYGKCCVSEFLLTTCEDETHREEDKMKLENIQGQKMMLEWLFDKESREL